MLLTALARASRSNRYCFNMGDGLVVDGEDAARSNFMRYCNHSRRRANLIGAFSKAFGVTYAIRFQSTRPIAPGEELLFDYGKGYWDSVYPLPLDPRRVAVDYF